jgi:hypothetical protein
MFAYSVYGHSLMEIEVNNHIKERALFGITVRDNPKWTAWYIYEQGLRTGDMALEFAAATAPDSLATVGKMVDGAKAFHLTYPDQINVNNLANAIVAGKYTTSPGSLTVREDGDNLRCRIDVSRKNAAVAHVLFDLVNVKDKDGKTTAANLVPNKTGLVRLLGWAAFSQGALTMGPYVPLSHAWATNLLQTYIPGI